MALIVEDGTGVEDANGLIPVAFADDYFEDRGVTQWAGTDEVKGQCIIRATDYFELVYGRAIQGRLSDNATTMSFPRVYLYDRKGKEVTGVPTEAKKAVAELALLALLEDLFQNPTYDASGKSIKFLREKVGPIETETEFFSSATQKRKEFRAVSALLRPILVFTGGVYR